MKKPRSSPWTRGSIRITPGTRVSVNFTGADVSRPGNAAVFRAAGSTSRDAGPTFQETRGFPGCGSNIPGNAAVFRVAGSTSRETAPFFGLQVQHPEKRGRFSENTAVFLKT